MWHGADYLRAHDLDAAVNALSLADGAFWLVVPTFFQRYRTGRLMERCLIYRLFPN